jgi:membrane protein DedA with SNARE-associated domain
MLAKYFADLLLISSQNLPIVYLIIYIMIFIIGDLSSLIGIFLAFYGIINWLILILIIFAASLTGDSFFYILGNILRDTKPGNWIKRHLPQHDKIEKLIEQHQNRVIVGSKFFPFIALPLFFSLGWFRVSFKKMIKLDLISITAWTIFLIIVGSFMASTFSFIQAKVLFGRLEIIVALFIILLIVIEFLVTKGMTKLITEDDKKFRRINKFIDRNNNSKK